MMPIGSGVRSVNVAQRQTLTLFAAIWPVRSVPGVQTRFEGVDLVIVGENTEGPYSAPENVFTGDVVVSMMIATPVACHRIALWVFRHATHRKRRRLSVFHKANIIRDHGGGLLEQASGSLGLHGGRCAVEFSAGGVLGKLPPLRRGRLRRQRGGNQGGTAATPVADAGSRIEAGSLPWARWGLDSEWCL